MTLAALHFSGVPHAQLFSLPSFGQDAVLQFLSLVVSVCLCIPSSFKDRVLQVSLGGITTVTYSPGGQMKALSLVTVMWNLDKEFENADCFLRQCEEELPVQGNQKLSLCCSVEQYHSSKEGWRVWLRYWLLCQCKHCKFFKLILLDKLPRRY